MKKNKKENTDKQNFLEVFKYLYKTYPGMKSLMILLLYTVLFSIIISVVAVNQGSVTGDLSEETTTVKTLTYREILDNVANEDKTIKYNITINDTTYYIDANYSDNILSGTYESSLGDIYKFIIKEDNIYEVSMSNEILNNELFSELNLNYIIPSHLIELLENNKAIKNKEEDNMIYTYNIDNITYKVLVTGEAVKNIEITSDNLSYKIELE